MHHNAHHTIPEAVEACGSTSVRVRSRKQGVPGRPLRIIVKQAFFPVADPGHAGHYFAPGRYLHTDSDFVESGKNLILQDGDLSRLAITPSGARRSLQDEAPEQRPPPRNRAAQRDQSQGIGRNRSPYNKIKDRAQTPAPVTLAARALPGYREEGPARGASVRHDRPQGKLRPHNGRVCQRARPRKQRLQERPDAHVRR